MPTARAPFIFISYRRQDSSAAARWLYKSFQTTFGPASTFMDTESIRIGDKWAEQINKALKRATILIAVIGPHWLHTRDVHGRRRIDNQDDWVRNEISHALDKGITLIPLLLQAVSLPARDALPEGLERLTAQQKFELRDDRWEMDLNLLLSRLEASGLKRIVQPAVRYPTPRVTLNELSPEEIARAFRRLPGWESVVSQIPGKEPLQRTEFKRAYEFKSFEDAMAFMSESASHVSKVCHHPRWENIWRTVTVFLSTWDIGHKPSRLDMEMAEAMDEIYKKYRLGRKESSRRRIANVR